VGETPVLRQEYSGRQTQSRVHRRTGRMKVSFTTANSCTDYPEQKRQNIVEGTQFVLWKDTEISFTTAEE